MRPVVILLHDLLLCERAPEFPEVWPGGMDVLRIPRDASSKDIDELLGEADALVSSHRVITFCSLDLARKIRKHHPSIATGLLCDLEKLRWHSYSGWIDRALHLNQTGILLPLGHLVRAKAQLARLFGDRIFMRPDRADKPFPGLVCDLDDLEREISGLFQVYALDPDLLVMVDQARIIEPVEYRFWSIEGEIVSSASYSFSMGPIGIPAPPEDAMVLAGKIARQIEPFENALTIDIAKEGGRACLVEINGLSTSGFYPQANLSAIFQAAADLFV